MKSLLMNLYSFISTPKGRLTIIGIICVLLTIWGISTYIKLSKLTVDENTINTVVEEKAPTAFEGKVSYVGDMGNNVSYALTNAEGKDVVLLKSPDSKLKIVEGLHVKVSGIFVKGVNNQKDTLIVKEIIINNGTN
jgi:hypothetical protein